MTQPPGPLRLFISYAHEDDQFRRKLEKHLSSLKREGLVEIWSDRAIEAGQEWEKRISQQLKTADIILLLISPDFIESEFIYDQELKQAMQRYEAGEASVVPVFLRPCNWKGQVFSKLQGVPDEARSIAEWSNCDRAFSLAAKAIRRAAESLHIELTCPSTRPSWASAFGRDGYGPWAKITVSPITGSPVAQRLRWIPPGRFLMGSPATEPGRDGDEGPQHLVTISRGFWLFDTACTQALWQAVMGDNPSHFESPDRPVEQMSWNEIQGFLTLINQLVPGVNLDLPTEAQWEYACRAGSITPFSFGANITPEQANYNGNYPYAGGEKGRNRKETVPVASLPPNPWGLFEMHGNVWEWCRDSKRHYGSGAETDPRGPLLAGTNRVDRGGSWSNDARNLRSAYRCAADPGYRKDDLGFRCARVTSVVSLEGAGGSGLTAVQAHTSARIIRTVAQFKKEARGQG